MPEQKKKVTSDTTKVESPKIPNVAYPLKPRSNTTNLSQQYFNHLAGDESARFLFNNSGLWHQGIHLRASKFPSSEFENNKICAIADGKLVAYKVDSEYKSDNESESSKESAVYSTGFFLLKHEVAYPKDNFLYVARGSQLYSIANDEAVVLEKSQVEIMVPLSDVAKKTVKKKTDKTGKDYYNVQPYLYSLPHKHQEGGIYVDSSHLTHGLLFPGVNIFNQSGNGLCIFKYPLHQNIDPKSDLTTEQKNELDPMFKLIMDELDLEKDKNAAVSCEAGKLKDLLLSPVQQRRLTGIVAKHDSEWKKTRAADFSQTCGVFRANGKEEIAKRIEKRIADLSIKLEVDGFNTDKQAYYLHPLGMIGWLAVSVGEFDWFETPLVKLIVSKESKGSFNAYNITGWDEKNRNRVYESHFEPTAQYHLEKMTIAEIRKAQTTEIGPNRKHMFAVGIFQMTPNTIFGKRKGDKCFMKWLSDYRNVNESEQLFNREFQQLTPLFFWEDKQEEISLYFMDKATVKEAAYAVAKEWSSAAVPAGEDLVKKKGDKEARKSDGTMSYYDSDGLNKAHYSADKTIEALEATKKMIDAAGGYDVVREISLSKIGG